MEGELCKLPEIVAGQETTITLRGHNLTTPGTKIHCAYKGKYTSTDVLPEDKTSMSFSDNILTDHRVQKFTFPGGLTSLHLAASIQNNKDLVDALTSDSQDVGL